MVAHILVVEDDRDGRDAIAELLRDQGYQVSTAEDGVAAVAAVDERHPDLVLSDVGMPRGGGLEMVKHLRERPLTAGIPIVLMSGMADPARRIVGLDTGADDFVAKPVNAGELLARVRAQLRRVDERQQLERRAVVDPLTGVLNRRGIQAVVHREIHRTRRLGGAMSMLVVDIDQFKAINDHYGHPVGDTVLCHVAGALSDAVRVADHVGRSGGDEFLVVVPDGDEIKAAALATRLRRLSLPPLAIDGGAAVTVTVSIGTATLRPDDTIDELFERADRAMYRVKRSGDTPGVTAR